MNELSSYQPSEEVSILTDPYAKDVQTDIWNHERKKLMINLIIVGAVLFTGDFLALAMTGLLNLTTIGAILVLPLLYVGLALFSRLQPLVSSIAGIILFITVMAYVIYTAGSMNLFTGMLSKAIIVFQLIVSVRHAREAEAARKELALMP